MRAGLQLSRCYLQATALQEACPTRGGRQERGTGTEEARSRQTGGVWQQAQGG